MFEQQHQNAAQGPALIKLAARQRSLKNNMETKMLGHMTLFRAAMAKSFDGAKPAARKQGVSERPVETRKAPINVLRSPSEQRS